MKRKCRNVIKVIKKKLNCNIDMFKNFLEEILYKKIVAK